MANPGEKKVTVKKEKRKEKGETVLVKRLKYTREQMAEIGQKTVKEGTDFMNGPETYNSRDRLPLT